MNAVLGLFIAIFLFGNSESSTENFFAATKIFQRDPLIKISLSPLENSKSFFENSQKKTTKFLLGLKKIPEKNIAPFLPSTETNLNFWLFGADGDSFSWPIQIFEKNSKTVKIIPRIFSDKKSYFSALQKSFFEGNSPDIALIPDDFFPYFSENLNPAPLELFSNKECDDFFFEFSCSAFSKGGDIFGLPLFVKISALIVNRDLLRDDRIALGDRPAKSWDLFLENAANFQKFQKEKYFLLLASDTIAEVFAQILIQSEKNLSQKNLSAVLENMKKFSHWAKSTNEEKNLFIAGNVAIIGGDFTKWEEWKEEAENTKNPLRTSAIALYPLPQNDEKNPHYLGRSFALVVPKNAQNPKLSWAILAFFAEEENMRAISDRSGKRVAWKFFGPFDEERDFLKNAFSPVGKSGGLEFSEIFSENGAAFFSGNLSAEELAIMLFPLIR